MWSKAEFWIFMHPDRLCMHACVFLAFCLILLFIVELGGYLLFKVILLCEFEVIHESVHHLETLVVVVCKEKKIGLDFERRRF